MTHPHHGATLRRLSDATLDALPATIARPRYDRSRTRIGIVHLGVGAFHRAHQAVFIDDLLHAAPDWAISGVSLHSPDVRDALRPQDGLYTLALLGEHPSLRVIGALRELLCARDEQAAVLARLAHPDVRLVTLTITEKGYCLAGDGLDFAHPDIAHDLENPQAPRSAIGYLVAGLRQRRANGLAPYTALSCDNLADNGGRLRRAVLQFAERIDTELAHWIEVHGAFPRSMVDSITPATDDALRAQVTHATGLVDAWPVQREPYTQWVIEDRFCNGRPPFERAGATMSDDIAFHERAKLRLLNGAHSTLAYVGLLLQLGTVADAMYEPRLAGFVETLMRAHVAPTLDPPSGVDIQAYIDAILVRFRNPAIRHRLAQIAWDGSQKLPVRLFGSIADALAANRGIDALCVPIAAWMHFVRRQAHAGIALVDPLADALAGIGRATSGDADADVDAFLRLDAVFTAPAGEPRFRAALKAAYRTLGSNPAEALGGG